MVYQPGLLAGYGYAVQSLARSRRAAKPKVEVINETQSTPADPRKFGRKWARWAASHYEPCPEGIEPPLIAVRDAACYV